MCRSEVRLAASLWLVFLVGCGAATPPTEEQETAENGVVPSGLFKLQYRIEGEGTPAIVIGFPNYYARVFSQDLRSHLRLVFVDHRGSAASPGKVETEQTCSTTFGESCSETSTSLAVWISSIDPFSWHWGDTTSWSPRHRPGSPSKTVSAISPSVFLKTVDIPPSTKSPTCSTERSWLG